MPNKANLSTVAAVAATLITASSVQASPTYFYNQNLFNNALGGETLWVEDFETLSSNTPSGTDFGLFKIETGDDIDKAPYGTNGPISLKISENSDDFIKFTFDAPITAFAIEVKDALDTGGGNMYVTLDAYSPYHFIGPTGDLPDMNLIFIGVIDLDGFTMVKIDSDDHGDFLYYDNLQHSKVAEPATIAMFGLGLVSLGYIRRRRSTKL